METEIIHHLFNIFLNVKISKAAITVAGIH